MIIFGDRKSVEAWTQNKDTVALCVFASRCAARVFPVIGSYSKSSKYHLDLRCARAILSASVRGMYITSDITKAAAAAHNSVFAAGRAVIGDSSSYLAEAIYSAESAAATASATIASHAVKNAAVSAAISNPIEPGISSANASDASALDHMRGLETGLFDQRLWLGALPSENILRQWDKLKYRWASEPKVWSFWIHWYEGLLEGRSPDWELWRDIALIEDAHWNTGPKAVAHQIERVKAELAAKRIPLAEDVVQNPNTGCFDLVPKPVAKADLLSATLSQVEDAIDDVLHEPRNGLTERSLDIRKLKRTIERYANDPQRVEMDFTTAHASILRQIAIQDIPASDENEALLTALQEGAQGIRATDPAIAENRRLLQEQASKELDVATLDALTIALPDLEEMTEGALQVQMREDILMLTQEMRVRPAQLPGVMRADAIAPSRDEAVRITSRLSRMYLKLIKPIDDLGKNIEGVPGVPTAKWTLRIGGLIALLWPFLF